MCFFFNPGPVRRVPIPNRYTAKAKLSFCKNNKRRIIIMWGNASVLKHTCRKCPENQHRLGLLNQVPITTSSLPPVRTGARRAQMVVLNLRHDGVPRGLSPFCSQLSRYLRVAMMMPFICSYRNKKAQLSSFLRVACGRQKVSWWPIGASIVATSIPASRHGWSVYLNL